MGIIPFEKLEAFFEEYLNKTGGLPKPPFCR